MFRTKIGGVLARGASKKLGPLLISATVEIATSNLVYNLGLDYLTKKQRLGPKLAWGLGQGSIRKKFGTPHLFLQSLKLATEKLVHNMSSGLPCQTQVLFM